jgi:hypothetical protein
MVEGLTTDQEHEQPAADLTRVIVNFTARSVMALDRASGLTNDTKTDTINRAVQLYAALADMLTDGGDLLVRQPGGAVEQVEVDWGWNR